MLPSYSFWERCAIVFCHRYQPSLDQRYGHPPLSHFPSLSTHHSVLLHIISACVFTSAFSVGNSVCHVFCMGCHSVGRHPGICRIARRRGCCLLLCLLR